MLQNQVHHLFYESLSKDGFLGLGDKETLSFVDVMPKYRELAGGERLYQKIY